MRIPGFSAATVGCAFAPLLVSLVGCGAQSPAHEKQLAEMRDKITILQNERDRLDERLTAVEARQAELVSELEAKPEREARPPLKVVVMKPEHAEATPGPVNPVGDLETDAEAGARPLISGQGQQVGTTLPEEKR